MPATVESAASQSDPQRTLDLDTLTQRLQATEMMLMLLACSMPDPDRFVNQLDTLRELLAKPIGSSRPEDTAEYVAAVERTQSFVKAMLEQRTRRAQ